MNHRCHVVDMNNPRITSGGRSNSSTSEDAQPRRLDESPGALARSLVKLGVQPQHVLCDCGVVDAAVDDGGDGTVVVVVVSPSAGAAAAHGRRCGHGLVLQQLHVEQRRALLYEHVEEVGEETGVPVLVQRLHRGGPPSRRARGQARDGINLSVRVSGGASACFRRCAVTRACTNPGAGL
jgi:hypothetical protein